MRQYIFSNGFMCFKKTVYIMQKNSQCELENPFSCIPSVTSLPVFIGISWSLSLVWHEISTATSSPWSRATSLPLRTFCATGRAGWSLYRQGTYGLDIFFSISKYLTAGRHAEVDLTRTTPNRLSRNPTIPKFQGPTDRVGHGMPHSESRCFD